MTEEELRLWKEAATNATRGPWETGTPYHHPYSYSASESNEPLAVYGMGMEIADTQLVQDAAFIALSREAMPALIAEVRRLRAELGAAYGHDYYTALHDALIVAEGQRDQLRAERDALRNEWSGLLIEQARLMALRDEAIAERDALRAVATVWCAECKGSGYITAHVSSANGGSVTTRKCVCGGNPFFKNATAEFWLEER